MERSRRTNGSPGARGDDRRGQRRPDGDVSLIDVRRVAGGVSGSSPSSRASRAAGAGARDGGGRGGAGPPEKRAGLRRKNEQGFAGVHGLLLPLVLRRFCELNRGRRRGSS